MGIRPDDFYVAPRTKLRPGGVYAAFLHPEAASENQP
jgi:hypothetical protein